MRSWRVASARRILFYELLMQPHKVGGVQLNSPFDLHAGDAGADGHYYVSFRSVTANSEGSGTGGQTPVVFSTKCITAQSSPSQS